MALLASESSPVLGLIGFFGILGAIGMVLSPTLSLVVVAASLPLERLGRITEDTAAYAVSVSRIVGLFALAAFLLFALFRRWRIHFGAPLLLYTGYTVIAAITMIYTNVPEETNRDVLRIIGNLLFFFYVINAMRSFQLVKLALIVWMAASAGTGLYSMYDYYYGNSETIEEGEMGLTNYRFSTVVNDDSESRTLGVKVKRAFGTTSHPTLFGLNLTMTLPFFAWMIAFQPWRWKIVSFPGFVVVCYNIVLSNTRAVMVLALLSLIFIGIRGLFRITPQMLLGMLLLGAAVLPFIPGDVFMRTLDPSLYTTAKSDSIRIRFKYWQKSVELAEQNWWTGIGVGDQTTIVDMVTDELSGRITPGGLKASAHNEFLWSLVEVGIIGWAFHWAFVGWVIWASFKAASWFRRWEDAREEYWLMIAGQIMLVGVVLFGIQTEVFHFGLKGWWMMAGITYAMYEMARRRMVAQALEDVHGNQG
ncbi:MAG TPA: O-antigen ligase family protein [Terriglobia bacterium]|nr:O-antigen ligase family protein [Terriglobia bacterium]